MVSRAPTARRRGPSAPQFWGFLSIYAYTFCRRTIDFDVVTHVGRGVYLGVSHASHSKTPGLPNLGFSYIYAYTLNAEPPIRHGNTYGEGRVLGQTRRCIYAKYVARFVSDSWVSCIVRHTVQRTQIGKLIYLHIRRILRSTCRLHACCIRHTVRRRRRTVRRRPPCIVKYALNEHAHSRRILPSSFSIYIHRSPASTNQTVSAYLSLRQNSCIANLSLKSDKIPYGTVASTAI